MPDSFKQADRDQSSALLNNILALREDIGEIKAKLDAVVLIGTKHESRIADLEQYKNYQAGAVKVIGLIWGGIGTIAGAIITFFLGRHVP